MLLNKMYPFIFQSNLNKKNFLIHINYHLLKETYIFNELVSDYIRNDIHNLLFWLISKNELIKPNEILLP